jgi:PadR family transcriptional regulator, regulatory protein AphA
MDLKQTILGIISRKPVSGYDLKRIISDSDIFYWSGNNNQIYKCLLELQKEGLVTFRTQLQENLPNKKIYTITEQGLLELHKGLIEPAEAPEFHKDILIHLAFAERLSNIEVIQLLKSYEEEIRLRLKMHAFQAAQRAFPIEQTKRETYIRQRVSDNVTAAYQIELAWLHETMEGLNRYAEKDVVEQEDV